MHGRDQTDASLEGTPWVREGSENRASAQEGLSRKEHLPEAQRPVPKDTGITRQGQQLGCPLPLLQARRTHHVLGFLGLSMEVPIKRPSWPNGGAKAVSRRPLLPQGTRQC